MKLANFTPPAKDSMISAVPSEGGVPSQRRTR